MTNRNIFNPLKSERFASAGRRERGLLQKIGPTADSDACDGYRTLLDLLGDVLCPPRPQRKVNNPERFRMNHKIVADAAAGEVFGAFNI